MNYTENYNLKKPEPAEQYNLTDWNDNTDSIDSAMNELQGQIDAERTRATAQEEANRNVNRIIGTLPINQGGTGQTTKQSALNTLHDDVPTTSSVDENDEITFIRRTQADVSQGIPESIDVKDATINTIANKVFEILKSNNSNIFSSSDNGLAPKTNSASVTNFLRADGQWGVPSLQENLIEVTTSDSYTLNSNTNMKITASSATTIVLANPSIIGLTVTIINTSGSLAHSLSCKNVEGNTVDSILPNAFFKIAWNGSAWVNITAPWGTFTQFPNQSSPDTVYPCTKWTEVNYDGAFFRASGGNASTFNSGMQGDLVKNHVHNMNHIHDKGNMEIYGDFYSVVSPNDPMRANGAFQKTGQWDSNSRAGSQSWTLYANQIDFKASRNWTGYTGGTKNPDWNNPFDKLNTEGNDPNGVENRPINYTIKIWKRTA